MTIIYIGACVVLVLCAVFYWPTLYHHEEIILGKIPFPVRTNRFTGDKEYRLATGEWKPLILDEEEKPGSGGKSQAQFGDLPVKDTPGSPESYSIQVGSSSNIEEIKQLHDELVLKGYQVKIGQSSTGEGALYHILIGEFQNEQEADSFAEQLNMQEDISGSVIRGLGIQDWQSVP